MSPPFLSSYSFSHSVCLSVLAAVVPTDGLRKNASISSFFAGSTPGYWHIKERQTAETGRLLEWQRNKTLSTNSLEGKS